VEKVVVDCGVSVKWYVAEPHAAEARRVLHDYRAGVISLLAPDLIFAEFGNVIWKKQRFQGLAAADAEEIVAGFQQLGLVIVPSSVLLEEAYRLAITHQRTVYDALYLALSVRESCRFVTSDEKLVNAVGSAFPNLIWVARWP
jgi:predicted nucleic acid-binding protein